MVFKVRLKTFARVSPSFVTKSHIIVHRFKYFHLTSEETQAPKVR